MSKNGTARPDKPVIASLHLNVSVDSAPFNNAEAQQHFIHLMRTIKNFKIPTHLADQIVEALLKTFRENCPDSVDFNLYISQHLPRV